jgi:hypothetical protein
LFSSASDRVDLCSAGCYVASPPAMSQNYKETLNLPRTGFPMKANLTGREPEMLKMWEETRLYQQIQKSREDRELFVLHDGPPFANGDVHMGTVLNILKDFVVKSQTAPGAQKREAASQVTNMQMTRNRYACGAADQPNSAEQGSLRIDYRAQPLGSRRWRSARRPARPWSRPRHRRRSRCERRVPQH